jgi:YD repeat-containing protein
MAPTSAPSSRTRSWIRYGAYKYDALYRLVEATGREHVSFGSAIISRATSSRRNTFRSLRRGNPSATRALSATTPNGNAYDDSGNITEIRQLGGGTTRWVRAQSYDAASNRILRSDAGCVGEGSNLAHDANGNLQKVAHLPELKWNDRNQLVGLALNASANP